MAKHVKWIGFVLSIPAAVLAWAVFSYPAPGARRVLRLVGYDPAREHILQQKDRRANRAPSKVELAIEAIQNEDLPLAIHHLEASRDKSVGQPNALARCLLVDLYCATDDYVRAADEYEVVLDKPEFRYQGNPLVNWGKVHAQGIVAAQRSGRSELALSGLRSAEEATAKLLSYGLWMEYPIPPEDRLGFTVFCALTRLHGGFVAYELYYPWSESNELQQVVESPDLLAP